MLCPLFLHLNVDTGKDWFPGLQRFTDNIEREREGFCPINCFTSVSIILPKLVENSKLEYLLIK